MYNLLNGKSLFAEEYLPFSLFCFLSHFFVLICIFENVIIVINTLKYIFKNFFGDIS